MNTPTTNPTPTTPAVPSKQTDMGSAVEPKDFNKNDGNNQRNLNEVAMTKEQAIISERDRLKEAARVADEKKSPSDVPSGEKSVEEIQETEHVRLNKAGAPLFSREGLNAHLDAKVGGRLLLSGGLESLLKALNSEEVRNAILCSMQKH